METELSPGRRPGDRAPEASTSRTPSQASGHAGRLERPRNAVLVGVDDSLGVLVAVSWAAAEAARRGADLHLLHVTRTDGSGVGESRRSMSRALSTASSVAPSVGLTAIREQGAVVQALARHSWRVCLLVLGGRRPADGGPSAGRTISEVIHHIDCPVVLVPPRRNGAWVSTPSNRSILVGIATGRGQHALDVAAKAAAWRRASVVVVNESAPFPKPRGTPPAPEVRPTLDLVSALRLAGRNAQLIVLEAPGACSATSQRAQNLTALLVQSPCPLMLVPVPCTGQKTVGLGTTPDHHLPCRTPKLEE